MIGTFSVVSLIFEATSSQSIVLSPTSTAAEILGKRWKISKASRLLWAVSTLNLLISKTSLRTDRACEGSGSATSNVGLGTAHSADLESSYRLQVASRGDQKRGTPGAQTRTYKQYRAHFLSEAWLTA